MFLVKFTLVVVHYVAQHGIKLTIISLHTSMAGTNRVLGAVVLVTKTLSNLLKTPSCTVSALMEFPQVLNSSNSVKNLSISQPELR